MRRQVAPGGELRLRLAKEADRQAPVKIEQGTENLWQETGDDVAALRGSRAQGLQHGMFESGNFELDVEKSRGLVACEDLVEFREIGKISGAGFRDFDIVDFGVVADDDAAIGRAANVEFKTVAAVSEDEVEGGQGVLGNGTGGTSTAMAQEERTEHRGIVAGASSLREADACVRKSCVVKEVRLA